MSYILDALKKSEKERNGKERGGVPIATDNIGDDYDPKAGVDRRLMILIVVLLTFALLASYSLWSIKGKVLIDQSPTPVATADKPESGNVVEYRNKPDPAPLANTPVGQDRRGSKAKVVSEPVVEATATDKGQALNYAALPFLWEVPEALRKEISHLVVTIHVYSPRSARRMLFINDREYRAGDVTREGVRVERVVPEGVILSFRDLYFKLPRPR